LTTDGSSPKHNNRVVEPISNNFQNTPNILLTIFNLCDKIEEKGEIYESNRYLLQLLWEEIGKEKVQWSIRRLWCFQETEILQSTMYENVNVKNRKSISKIPTSTSNCCQYNEEQANRKKVFDMWEDWKSRYTSYRWGLSEQLFREFNLFMSKLSYENTQTEVDMQDLRTTYESIRILRETLSKIQKIWQPVENKIQNYRIRKLTPKETWRLMGFNDTDIDNAIASGMSNAQLYKQAGNSIVVDVLMAIFKKML
jgi:site-specific DNA-cytosine methylase